jgi:hypothetical protein
MKLTKSIFITAILTLLTFSAIVYTSCRKDRCKRVVCQNGGTCTDGFCYCPSGYTGTYCQIANVSSIAFKNKTFTPVKIIVKGIEYSVDSGKTITFTGGHGETLEATASTRGYYGVNVPIPIKPKVFPVRNTEYIDLNVGTEYFFLMATDSNATVPEISLVYVNYKQRDSSLDVVTLPTPIKNTGKTHHIGYYKAYTDTKIRLEKTPDYWTFNKPLRDTLLINQYYNAIVK